MLNFGLALAENQDPQEPDIVPEFTYRVVKPGNIRLLLIHPRSYSEPIRCSLVEVSIEQPPRFEATSYTWGSEEKPGVAIVDGKLLRITQNAYDLLQDLSSLCFPRLIWIDSISINQDDDIEKSEQIQLMTQIYQKASRVIVWLGNNPRAASDAQLSIITPDACERWQALRLFLCHPWFNRIWVVQEIALAR
ncbi:HET-domain-containing protein, partial [Cadophora sp. DSE1049]